MHRILFALLLTACSTVTMEVDASMVEDDDAGSLADAGEAVGEDGGTVVVADAGETLRDAGRDASAQDSGAVDGGADIEPDAGVASPCGSDVYDAAADRCYRLVSWVSGDFCPTGWESIRWADLADQYRVHGLLRFEGSGGTGLRQNVSGTWRFIDTGEVPGRVDWAVGYPVSGERHSYFSSDGLRSFHRGFSSQWCMRDL